MICLPPNFQYKKWTSAGVRDRLARYVALINAAACVAALNGTAMCLVLLYTAVPSAGDDASRSPSRSDQPATVICYTLVYASVCGTGADAAVGLATILCHALLYSLACRVYVDAQGSLAGYEALHYAAAGCAYAAAPNEITWYLALTHEAAGRTWAAALEGTAGYVALLIEAVCWAWRWCARRDCTVRCFAIRCRGLGLRC